MNRFILALLNLIFINALSIFSLLISVESIILFENFEKYIDNKPNAPVPNSKIVWSFFMYFFKVSFNNIVVRSNLCFKFLKLLLEDISGDILTRKKNILKKS